MKKYYEIFKPGLVLTSENEPEVKLFIRRPEIYGVLLNSKKELRLVLADKEHSSFLMAKNADETRLREVIREIEDKWGE